MHLPQGHRPPGALQVAVAGRVRGRTRPGRPGSASASTSRRRLSLAQGWTFALPQSAETISLE